ncbi:MAG: zinc ribbon domain-containing protein [Candidatus Nanoarchaeia archaeon]|nr:zinc ribbon domain-containing protein [Candidatus Nanoarchaeia archaeon]
MEKEGLLIRRCPKCGAEVKNNDLYCINCGFKLPAFCNEEKEGIIPRKAGKLTKYMFYLGTALFAISLILFSIFVIIDKTEPDSLSEIIQNTPPISEQQWLNLKEQIEADTTGYYAFTGNKTIDVIFEEPLKNESEPYSINDPIPISVKITNRLPEDIPANEVKIKLTGDATMPYFFSGANEPFIPTLKGIDPSTGNENSESITIGPLQYVGKIVEGAKIVKMITGKYCYQVPLKIKAKLFYTPNKEYIGSNLHSGSNPPSPIKIINIQQEPIVFNLQGIGELKFSITIAKEARNSRGNISRINGALICEVGGGFMTDCESGTILPSMSDCFRYRDRLSKQVLTLSAEGAYPIECDNNGIVQISSDTYEGTINCAVKNISYKELGKISSDLTLTLDNFAYEEEISPSEIWINNPAKPCAHECSCTGGHCTCSEECIPIEGDVPGPFASGTTIARCGDGIIQQGETCLNCPSDVGC